jgi:hypothetical protein
MVNFTLSPAHDRSINKSGTNIAIRMVSAENSRKPSIIKFSFLLLFSCIVSDQKISKFFVS